MANWTDWIGHHEPPPTPRPSAGALRAAAAALAYLPEPWLVLRSRRPWHSDGPPWVNFIALHPKKGIALVDVLPAQPDEAVEPLEEFLARKDFPAFAQGGPPILALALHPQQISTLVPRVAALFTGTPPCRLQNPDWAIAVAELLVSIPGLMLDFVERSAASNPAPAQTDFRQQAPPQAGGEDDLALARALAIPQPPEGAIRLQTIEKERRELSLVAAPAHVWPLIPQGERSVYVAQEIKVRTSPALMRWIAAGSASAIALAMIAMISFAVFPTGTTPGAAPSPRAQAIAVETPSPAPPPALTTSTATAPVQPAPLTQLAEAPPVASAEAPTITPTRPAPIATAQSPHIAPAAPAPVTSSGPPTIASAEAPPVTAVKPAPVPAEPAPVTSPLSPPVVTPQPAPITAAEQSVPIWESEPAPATKPVRSGRAIRHRVPIWEEARAAPAPPPSDAVNNAPRVSALGPYDRWAAPPSVF